MAKTYLPTGAGAPFKNIIRFIGSKPLDGRAVVDTYSDIQGDNYKAIFTNLDTDGVTSVISYYTGMLVVTADTGKLYVLVDKTRMVDKLDDQGNTIPDGNGGTVKVEEAYKEFDEVTPDLSNIHGSITAEDLAAATELATANNIGQVIYIPTKTDENGVVTNASEAGAYIVAGAGAVSKLATTTASGDLVADVTALQGDVAAIKRDYATTAAVNKALEDYTTTKDLEDNYATINDWKVKDVAENDKVLSLTEGVLSSSLSYTREDVNGVDSLVLKGKNNEVLGSVPVADFVVDGMLQKVEHDGNKLVFTFNTNVEEDETPTVIEVDLADYIDAYTGTDGEIVVGSDNTIALAEAIKTKLDTAASNAAAAKAVTDDLDAKVAGLGYAKTSEVEAKGTHDKFLTDTFNPWQETVNTKLGELETAIGNAGKVDDVQHDGTSIVENKIANLNNIFATSLNDTETKAMSVKLAKESFLKIDDVVALGTDDIDDILLGENSGEEPTEPVEPTE